MKFFQRNSGHLSQVFVLSVLFGFAGGVVGQLVSDAYINPPQQSLVNVGSGEENLIPELRPVRRFLGIEQDFEVNNAINKLSPTIAGVYSRNSGAISLTQIYLPGELLSTAFSLTSDGWFVSYDGFINEGNIDSLVVVYNRQAYDVEEYIIDSVTGILFLKIPATNLPVAVLGDSDETVLGQLVLTLNDLGEVVVSSVKSNKHVDVSSGADYVFSSEQYSRKFLLSDTAQENYLGSPVTNLAGEVVGIVSQTEGSLQVVPMNQFRSIVLDVLRNGFTKRSYLGVEYLDLSVVKGLDNTVSQNQTRGALIYGDPASGSPAAQADIEANDIILNVNGQAIDENDSLTDLVQQYQPGEKLSLEILRDGQNVVVEATLAIIPE